MKKIGINFVCEKDTFLLPLKLKDEYYQCEGLVIDYFDFNIHTFSDYLDYLDFLEYNIYYIVFSKENCRLDCIVKYLNDNLEDTSVKLITIEELFLLFEKEQGSINKNHIQNLFNEAEQINLKDIYRFGYSSYISGMYGIEFKNNMIKHIYLENSDLIECVEKTFLDICSINSCIYLTNKEATKSNLLMTKSITEVQDYGIEIMKMKENTLYDEIQLFVDKGIVTSKISIIEDYGHITGISRMNSLTIDKEGNIYSDHAKKKYLVKIDTSISLLKNKFSQINQENNFSFFPKKLRILYPLYILFNKTQEKEDIKLITNYNNNVLEGQKSDAFHFTNWIGLIKKEKHYIYNFQTSRMFNVDSLFLEIFEHIIKDIPYENNSLEIDVKRMLLRYE